MAAVSPFDDATIEQLARVIGDTNGGYTGTEIARLLRVSRVPDPGEMTKWRRIATALSDAQASSRSGGCVVAFVKAAMQPVRWTGNRPGFDAMRGALNGILRFPRESGHPTCRLDEAAGRMSPWQSQEGSSPTSTRPRRPIE